MALQLDPAATALVLTDLQHGIRALPVQPHTATSVLHAGRDPASAFRKKGAGVVYVRVDLASMQPRTVPGRVRTTKEITYALA